jgi:c-di-GMP-binding flagellar brake protein YcgR
MEERSGGREIIETIFKLHCEQRKFTRIPIHAQAKILIDDRVVEGTVKKISLGGVFVELDEAIPLGRSVIITIIDNQTSHTISELCAKVVSETETGIGLQFESTIIA